MYLKIWKFMLLATLMLSVAVHAGFELEAESKSKASQDMGVVESVESVPTQDVLSIPSEGQSVQGAKEDQGVAAQAAMEEQAVQAAKEEQVEQEAKVLQEAQAAYVAKEEQAVQAAKEEQVEQEAKVLQEAQAAYVAKEEQAVQAAEEEQAAQEAKVLQEAQAAYAAKEEQAVQAAKEEQAAQEAKALQEAQAAYAAKEEQAAQEARALQAAQAVKEEQRVRLEQVAQAAQISPKKIIASMVSFDLLPSKASRDEQVIEEVRVLRQEPVVLPVPSRWDIRINDVTLRQALSRWSSDAGWQLAWEVKVDYPVQLEASFSGTFESAVEHFINALRNSDYPLVACLYEGNRVVRVLHYGENKGCVQ